MEGDGEAEPRCPRCRCPLGDALAYRRMSIRERGGEGSRDVVVVFCERCGNALGAL